MLSKDIDLGSCHLSADGLLKFPSHRSVQLPSRLARPLVSLSAARGQAVSKEVLIEACWPEADVGEESLARAVADLRKIFRLEGFDPIETVYGVGYRLRISESDNYEVKATGRAESFRQEAWHRVAERQSGKLDVAERLFSMALEEEEAVDDWLGLAQIQLHRIYLGYASIADVWPHALMAIARALEYKRADALALLAVGLSTEWSFEDAEEKLSEARRIEPEGYLPNECSGIREMAVGDFEKAAFYFRRAMDVMPAALPAQGRLAHVLALDRRVDEALSVARGMVRLDDQSAVSTGYGAMVESWLGDPERAVVGARRCVDQLPKSPLAQAILAYALAVSGEKESAAAVLDLPAYETATVGLSAMASPVWVALDCPERALAALKHAFDRRCPWLPTLIHDPRIVELRVEPEFHSIHDAVLGPVVEARLALPSN